MRRWIFAVPVLGCLAGLFFACYGRAIFRGEQFAYRDAGHYYYPLHQRVQAEWDAGRWPLWEPEENSGMPLLGNPTAAVLYPGKLVFALFPYPLAARLYVMGHTLLAYAAMLAWLRHCGTRSVGSNLGAMAYAFGGPVLFQYCNIIFLVGAAWLPLGFRAADRWLRFGRRIAVAELAVVLAMETLGGDPESAYLTGLCAAAFAVGLAYRSEKAPAAESAVSSPGISQRSVFAALFATGLALMFWLFGTLALARWVASLRPVGSARQPQPSLPWTPWVGPAVAAAWGIVAALLLVRWRRRRRAGARPILMPMLFGLLAAATLAAALSGAQLLPILEFTLQSGRASIDGTHDFYPFSLQPFRVVEFLWPNVFGTSLHGNRLWLAIFPPHDVNVKNWVPTLYLGTLTLVLALVGACLRSDRASISWRAWMTAIAVVSLLGSFGEYSSPVWFARNVPSVSSVIRPPTATDASAKTASSLIRDGDGGVYWLLAVAFPGFRQFRFPSKLLTLTVLALTSLAAQGWDALALGDPRTRRLTAVWTGVLLGPTLIVLAVCVAGRGEFSNWLASRKLDSMFGPFNAPGAVAETEHALMQSAAVLATTLVLALFVAGRRPAMAGTLALALMTVDLASANARMVITVPQALMDFTPDVISILEHAEREKPGRGPYRVHRVAIWSPMDWMERASPNRISEFVAWERQTAEPKYGINYGVHYTTTLGVAQLYDYDWFFGGFYYGAREKASRALGVKPGTQLLAYSRRAFDMWNTRYFILPYFPQWQDAQRGIASFLENTERINPAPDAFEGADGVKRALAWLKERDYQVRRNLGVFPRAWVVHEARTLPTFRALRRAGRNVPMLEMLFSNDMSWPDSTRIVYDPRRLVWLEESDRNELAPYLSGGDPGTVETVRVVQYVPDRVELETTLQRPGIVVLADVFYPGWTLTIDGKPAQVYRANRLMRGAGVDAGQHTLVYAYRPWSFRIGLVLSGLGLVSLTLLVLGQARALRPDAGPASRAPRGA